MVSNRKRGLYFPYSASHLREAVVNGRRPMKSKEFRFIPHGLTEGEITFNNFVMMTKERDDTTSWNFTSGITSLNFNDGQLPASAFSRIECLLGLPLMVEKGEIYIMIGNKKINLPSSGLIPIRHLLNNILRARSMPTDIGNHNIRHGSNIGFSNKAPTWFILRGQETSRTIPVIVRSNGAVTEVRRVIDRNTLLNISFEQGEEDEFNQGMEFCLYV